MCGISKNIFTNISIYSNNKNYIDHEQLISIFIDYPEQWMNETKLQLKKEKMIRVRGAKIENFGFFCWVAKCIKTIEKIDLVKF